MGFLRKAYEKILNSKTHHIISGVQMHIDVQCYPMGGDILVSDVVEFHFSATVLLI